MTWRPGDPWEDWSPLARRVRLRSVEACERESWSLVSWPRGAVDLESGSVDAAAAQPSARAFQCGSWRCRRCARLRGASDFARARDAILARPWWLYAVLTFDRRAYASPWEAYREGGRAWDEHLRQSMRRRGGRIEYIQTWEAHRSGWPHANLLMTGGQLRSWVESLGMKQRVRESLTGGERLCVFPRGWRRWFRDAAQRAGFGGVVWVEVIEPKNPAALAGYLVKLARELTGGVESGKGYQSPLEAPRHFRRIRASRGLLPKSLLASPNGGDFEGRLSPTRCVREPSPERRPGAARTPSVATTWAHVFGLLEAEARERAEQWALTTQSALARV